VAVSIATLIGDYWHLVAHRSELALPGDFVRLDWAAGELALYNDGGEVIAFDNVCPHRGGRFFAEDRGSGRAICPYHGWAVRDGKVRVARPQQFSACDLGKAVINRFRTEWCGDFLFVGLQPVMSLAEQLDAFAPTLSEISGDMATSRDLYKIDFQADWRVAAENALEAYHINNVHPGTLAPLAFSDETDSFAGPNSAYHARIGSERTVRGLKGLRRFFDISAGFEGYCAYYLFPFAMISSTFGYSYALQTYFPSGEAHRSWFTTRLYGSRAAPGSEGVLETLLNAAAPFNRQVFDEDHEICQRVSRRYDLNAEGRIFGASEARVRHLAETLRAIEGDQAASAASHQRWNIAR
jgi:phenylpropionate dioxygenase-like ring-hydroxylating dioxygenase large terminal subunit